MAKVLQIESVGNAVDENYVNGAWHAVLAYPYPHTVCGIQLEGEDGVIASKEVDGVVTCNVCIGIISETKAIRKWKHA